MKLKEKIFDGVSDDVIDRLDTWTQDNMDDNNQFEIGGIKIPSIWQYWKIFMNDFGLKLDFCQHTCDTANGKVDIYDFDYNEKWYANGMYDDAELAVNEAINVGLRIMSDNEEGWIKTGNFINSPEGKVEMINIIGSSIDPDTWRKNNPPAEGGYLSPEDLY